MFDFGKPIKDVESKSGGGFIKPPAGGYKMRILKASITNSKAGKPMLVLEADIADGPFVNAFSKFPKKYFQSVSNDVGKGIVRKIIEVVINEPDNIGLIKPTILEEQSFDEGVLIGLVVGGILIPDGEYTKLDVICSTEEALKRAPKTDAF